MDSNMQSFCGIGKRKLHDQASEISDCWDYCCSLPILKKFNAVSPQKSSVDSPSEENIMLDDDFDFSYMSELLHYDQDVGSFPDVNMKFCDQASQGGCGYVDGFLQSENPENILISAMKADNLKVLNENQEIETGSACTNTGSACTNTHSFPTLMDVQSALLRENQSGAISATDSVSNSSSKSWVFNSFHAGALRSHAWFPTSGLKRDQDIMSQTSYRSFSRSIDELFYRRLNRAKNESKYSLNIKCPGTNIDDGYKWRKYGQKAIKNSPHPRSYYRCTNPRCFAKKQVERSAEDPETITITYEGLHMHYSYSQIQLTQPNNNGSLLRRLQGDNSNSTIIKEENPSKDHKEYINNNKVDEGAVDPKNAPSSFKTDVVEGWTATVAVHQRHHQEEVADQVEENCETLCIDGRRDMFGGSCGGGIGVVEHGGGRADGLLQDIVPLRIINPFSSSSSSSSSSSP